MVDMASALPGALSWLGAAREVAVIVGSLNGVGGAALGLDQKQKAAGQAVASVHPGVRFPDRQLCL
ncbi:hypothetical protein MAXJ12_28293 [Mesorhizobium alhagi CCNWXJ12-2]|jgi:hypothetical protein|uniref:Uncharacterized protein n=1 Tax=Mesorhizobium alhagi CCNWXJ12-2 TaxID=1107882 RepID=H0HZM2_9HYPH|nr:hypothetical protein MAXJ12_28293 [Mesorhizobium alhagi CCNWXJ12-2]